MSLLINQLFQSFQKVFVFERKLKRIFHFFLMFIPTPIGEFVTSPIKNFVMQFGTDFRISNFIKIKAMMTRIINTFFKLSLPIFLQDIKIDCQANTIGGVKLINRGITSRMVMFKISTTSIICSVKYSFFKFAIIFSCLMPFFFSKILKGIFIPINPQIFCTHIIKKITFLSIQSIIACIAFQFFAKCRVSN